MFILGQCFFNASIFLSQWLCGYIHFSFSYLILFIYLFILSFCVCVWVGGEKLWNEGKFHSNYSSMQRAHTQKKKVYNLIAIASPERRVNFKILDSHLLWQFRGQFCLHYQAVLWADLSLSCCQYLVNHKPQIVTPTNSRYVILLNNPTNMCKVDTLHKRWI